MVRSLLIALLALAATACGGGGTSESGADAGPQQEDAAAGADAAATSAEDSAATCADGADNDGDGQTDCADSACAAFCAGPDAGSYDAACVGVPGDAGVACTRQSDCDPDLLVNQVATGVCLTEPCRTGGHCRPPGPTVWTNDAGMVPATVQVEFTSVYPLTVAAKKAPIQVTRLVWPTLADGTRLTCSGLEARSGKTQATRDNLEKDPQINQALRAISTLNWPPTPAGSIPQQVLLTAPKGGPYLLYVEAWMGPRDFDYPSGQRGGWGCAEDVDLTNATHLEKFQVNVKSD